MFDLSKLKLPREGYGGQTLPMQQNVFKPVSPPTSSNNSRVNEEQPHFIPDQPVVISTPVANTNTIKSKKHQLYSSVRCEICL